MKRETVGLEEKAKRFRIVLLLIASKCQLCKDESANSLMFLLTFQNKQR